MALFYFVGSSIVEASPNAPTLRVLWNELWRSLYGTIGAVGTYNFTRNVVRKLASETPAEDKSITETTSDTPLPNQNGDPQ